MPADPLFRLAAPADLDTLLRLMREMQADGPWSGPFRDDVVRAALLELFVTPSAGLAYLIENSGSAIGYIILSFDFSLEYAGKNSWVDEFYVQSEFRGRGIGSAALEFAARAARDHGAKVMHLEVRRDNPALRLYLRHGYQPHDRFLLSKWLIGE
jgi:GNAT superfamily N-acetyltransferase